MLANPRLSGFFRRVPLIHLVVDEASQIEIGNYATIFNNGMALRKVCFIGDDKQCEVYYFICFKALIPSSVPPHGTEEIEVLESIFEKRHLRDSMCFLDTQCMSLIFFRIFYLFFRRSYASANWSLHLARGL